jgi:hypothetical protein
LTSAEETIEVVRAFRFEVPDKARHLLGVCNPYKKVYVVGLNNETDDFYGVEFLCSCKGGTYKHIHESQRDKGKPILGSKGNEVYLPRYEKSRITHAGIIGERRRELLQKGAWYQSQWVRLNNEADDSYGVEFLGSGKGGADKHIHESQRDKGKSLLGSKGDEVYLSRNEKSWIAHAGIIGERRRELRQKGAWHQSQTRVKSQKRETSWRARMCE